MEVARNGTVAANYEYSPDGLREVKRGSKGTIHYVFEGTEPIFEKNITSGKIKSYVYALGKHLARVDGVIGNTSAKVYYYHTDYLGSVRVITDQDGKVIFNADYLAFGTKFVSNGDFDEVHGFTGKEYDVDIGLYYYNARWYDPELGRFISEDPAADPNNPNLYSYCGNNGITRTDPTGMFFFWDDLLYAVIIGAIAGAIDAACNGGNILTGAFVGAVGGAICYLGGTFLGEILGPAASSTTLGGAACTAFGAGLSSGTMSEAMGGSFRDGFNQSAGSSLIASWLCSMETVKPKTDFLKNVKTWFNGALGDLAATGRYEFSASDALLLCGIDDEIKEALSNAFDNAAAGVGGSDVDNSSYQQYQTALEYLSDKLAILQQHLNSATSPEERQQIQQQIKAYAELIVKIRNQISFIWPTSGTITSPYTEYRKSTDPKVYPDGPHRAMDIANEKGTPIVAIANGVVVDVIRNNYYSGNIIIIDYGNGFTSAFHHLNGFADGIGIGTTVSQGQLVGYMGKTGKYCNGPHLHFELRYNGKLVNPADYLPKQ